MRIHDLKSQFIEMAQNLDDCEEDEIVQIYKVFLAVNSVNNPFATLGCVLKRFT